MAKLQNDRRQQELNLVETSLCELTETDRSGNEVTTGNFGRFPKAWRCRPNQWLTLVGDNLARSRANSRAILIELSTYTEDFPIEEYESFHQALGQFAFAVRDLMRRNDLPREVAVVHRHDSGWFSRILYEVPKGVRTKSVVSALAECWPSQYRYRVSPALSWRTEARNQLFWVNLARWDYLVFARDYENPDGILRQVFAEAQRLYGANA